MTGPRGDAPPPEPPAARTGLVLSGGGAKGAFEAGVLLALADGRSMATGYLPLAADVYTGTSVGAFNVTFLAARCSRRMPDAADELVDVWRRRIADGPRRCGNSVFRLRLSPFDLLDPGCLRQPLRLAANFFEDSASLARSAAERGAAFFAGPERRIEKRVIDTFDLTPFFSEQPLRDLLPDVIDLDELRTTPGQLAVITSNFRLGTVTKFDQHAIADRVGFDAILASTALPGFFPPVDIDGEPHVDGGLVMNTPLKPAIRLGAEVIHAVYLDPGLANMPLPPIESTAEALYRSFSILIADHVNADIAIAARINQLIRLRTLAGEEVGYRPVTIHRYRPATDLGGADGLLDFRAAVVEGLIEEGYRAAVEHDCTADGCILPEVEGREATLQDRDLWHEASLPGAP